MVEKLKRELIAKRATPSLKRKQSEQLLKAKDLVKELNAEQEAAKMLVETLKRGLIAETATSTEARKQVKASSIECQFSGGKLELRMAMRTSWVKFRLVIRSWKRMVELERRRAMRSSWPKFRLVIRSWKCVAELERRMAMRSSWLKFRLVVDSWLRIARETKPVHWPDTDDEFD